MALDTTWQPPKMLNPYEVRSKMKMKTFRSMLVSLILNFDKTESKMKDLGTSCEQTKQQTMLLGPTKTNIVFSDTRLLGVCHVPSSDFSNNEQIGLIWMACSLLAQICKFVLIKKTETGPLCIHAYYHHSCGLKQTLLGSKDILEVKIVPGLKIKPTRWKANTVTTGLQRPPMIFRSFDSKEILRWFWMRKWLLSFLLVG